MMQTWTTDSSSLKIGALLELMNHPFQLTLIQACCYTASKLYLQLLMFQKEQQTGCSYRGTIITFTTTIRHPELDVTYRKALTLS